MALGRRRIRVPADHPRRAALILALLVSTDRAGDITIPGSTELGTTRLHPAALTGALTREIETYHGVQDVKGRIIGDASDPEIVVTVTARQTADLPALHRRVESEALAHAGRHSAKPTCPSS